MKLRDLLAGCEHELIGYSRAFTREERNGALDAEISGIAYDSRKVVRGGMFVALRGEDLDGHDFVDNALENGAVAVVSQRKNHHLLPFTKGRAGQRRYSPPVYIGVDDSRRALACISNNFYGRPSEGIAVIGITGTNGKTTTSYIIKSVLEAWGKRAGLIGTIAHFIGDKQYPAYHTTPESVEFQRLLHEMATEGCSHVVTEVSSHSLSQKRVDYTRFLVVVFTNLTRDHLDFHETMENYYSAKERLFTELLSKSGTAVINVDDEWGRRLLRKLAKNKEEGKGNRTPFIITYGIDMKANISASQIENTTRGASFTFCYGSREWRMDSHLIGIPNVYNMLAATAACIALNIPVGVIQEGVKNAGLVRGRIEKMDSGQDFLCIIDYAHTPDAIERLILTARTLLKDKVRPGRVITLFGCGGDRDRGKRPVMGEIATRLSDYVIITSDNPRSEDPGEIIKDIVSGITRDNYIAVTDRKKAIIMAVEQAEKGDILLIAGKGHEDYQEIRGIRHSFSDRKVAEKAIQNKLRGDKVER